MHFEVGSHCCWIVERATLDDDHARSNFEPIIDSRPADRTKFPCDLAAAIAAFRVGAHLTGTIEPRFRDPYAEVGQAAARMPAIAAVAQEYQLRGSGECITNRTT